MTSASSRLDAVCAGRRYLVFSDLVRFSVTGADTGGAYTVVESIMPRGSGSPILHTHPQQETLYAVEGEYLVSTIARRTLRSLQIGPGGVVHIPGGVPHTIKNVSAAQGKLLAIFAPAGIEYFFAEVGVPVTDLGEPAGPNEPPSLAQLMAVLAKHQITFVEPPTDVDE